jgi:hypothetical protein
MSKRLLKAAQKAFDDYIYHCGCKGDGDFMKRSDGCCLHEDKDIGCQWYDYCEVLAKQKAKEVTP